MSRANQPGVFVCGEGFWLLAPGFWPARSPGGTLEPDSRV